MAAKFNENKQLFGPEKVSEIKEGVCTKDEHKEQIKLIQRGQRRIQEKVKEIRQNFYHIKL